MLCNFLEQQIFPQLLADSLHTW